MQKLLPVVVSAILYLVPWAASAESGVVALEDTPGCDRFILETSLGYVLVEWYGGVIAIYEGDAVHGDLHSFGLKDIYFEGRGEMRVWIEDYMQDEEEALEYFNEECS